jgi:hypothetical protein
MPAEKRPRKRRRRRKIAPVVWPQGLQSAPWFEPEDIAKDVDTIVREADWGREFTAEVEDRRAGRA